MKSSVLFILFFTLPVSLFGHGVSDVDKAEMVKGGLADYLFLGAKHMVTGYDHILFLIGVIFFLTKFSDIVKFITAFTVGHSLTLILATLFGITANYYLVDAVIAGSVIYKGFENLDGFKKCFLKNPPNLTLMVFLFGLVHGFGLSTRLQQISLGDHNLAWKIISFNAGVEVGQIAVLAIVYPLLRLIRGPLFGTFSKIVNSGLIVAGALLLVYQLVGYFTFPMASHLPEIRKDTVEKHQQSHQGSHHHDHHGHDHHHDH
ncbi:MAG: HupE/UreJ family protein [Kiritimatiellae bacterium]|nr:HupE/UreJ family protein [Kiritimatiellia bacterium]